jgi:hypothetical protein
VLTRLAASAVLSLALSAQLAAQVTPPSPIAARGFGLLGTGIGASGLALVHSAGGVELLTSSNATAFGFSWGAYWLTLKRDAASGTYQETYVSPSVAPETVVRTLSADCLGDAAEEIVIGISDGTLLVVDAQSKATLTTIHLASGGLTALCAGDLDGDGKAELLALANGGLYACSAAGAQLWNVPGPSGFDMVAAQMDGDPALEIACTNGDVIDAGTRTLQWHWPVTVAVSLAAGDIDGDGRAELVEAQDWNFVRAFDVELQQQKWSIPFLDLDRVALADLDGNGTLELLVGEGQWGEVRVFDTATQTQIDHIPNPDHGVSGLSAGDVDGDGAVEILWSAGFSSTGADHLRIVDRQTHALEYESEDLVGPVVGVRRGDIDGDGQPEIVALTFQSDSGYSSGRILVLDPTTLHLRALGPRVGSGFSLGGARAIELANIDADPQLEIVVACDHVFAGAIEIYDFSAPNTFNVAWTNATFPSGTGFQCAAVGDVDGDGNLEVVGGADLLSSGSQGGSVYVYDLATHQEEWHSSSQVFEPVARIELADTDQDGQCEIVALNRGSGDVYVYDGATKALEALIPGNFTSLSLLDAGPTPANPRPLVLGDANGNVAVYRFNGTNYVPAAQAALSSGAIDNAQAQRRNVFVQAGGTIRQHAGLHQVPLWQSANYGMYPGNRVLYSPSGPLVIVAATTFGVFGF